MTFPLPGDSLEVQAEVDLLNYYPGLHVITATTNGSHSPGSLHKTKDATSGIGRATDCADRYGTPFDSPALKDLQRWLWDNYGPKANNPKNRGKLLELIGPDHSILVGSSRQVSAAYYGSQLVPQYVNGREVFDGHHRHCHFSVLRGVFLTPPTDTRPKDELDMLGIITRTISGKGYWEVKPDGGIFTFGDARKLCYDKNGNFNPIAYTKKPIVDFKWNPTWDGYWFVDIDGAVFSFGKAQYKGGANDGKDPNRIIVSMAVTPSGKGYWLMGKDGAVFSFGDAKYYGGAN